MSALPSHTLQSALDDIKIVGGTGHPASTYRGCVTGFSKRDSPYYRSGHCHVDVTAHTKSGRVGDGVLGGMPLTLSPPAVATQMQLSLQINLAGSGCTACSHLQSYSPTATSNLALRAYCVEESVGLDLAQVRRARQHMSSCLPIRHCDSSIPKSPALPVGPTQIPTISPVADLGKGRLEAMVCRGSWRTPSVGPSGRPVP